MFRRLSLLWLSLFSFMSFTGMTFALPVHAEDSVQTRIEAGLNGAAAGYGDVQTDPSVIIGRLISIALGIFGSLLFIYMIYGGVLWMTAGGEEGKVKKAREMIKNAIIGIVIITLAYTIANYVIRTLGEVTAG